jgi:GntR family histidine utilization transcriptional repressor
MTALHDIPRVQEAPSLHRRILADITDKIVSGEWPPGHRIPFEYELSAQYGCSRMTVNKALSQLAKAGLIERRRRSGSFVSQPKSQAAILEIHDIKTEVQALGLPYRYELLGRTMRRATAGDRERLGLAGPSPVIALACRHFAGARPFCHEDRVISLAAVPEAEGEAFQASAPGRWLVDRVPWSVAEHRIRASGADASIVALLDIEAGAPCLVVERRTWSAEAPVTHVRFTYAGDSHMLVARFTP